MTHIALQTRFTEMFDLQVPIMSAPMSNHSGATLAAAVSNAGGLGMFGSHRPGDIEWLPEEINLAKSLTDRDFGVGFIVREAGTDLDLFNVAIEEKVPVILFSFADASELIARAKSNGCRAISQVQTFQDAENAIAAGVDVLVAQGNEAGGHTGSLTLAPLLESIRDAFPNMPVLAAGAISSGERLAGAIKAGADGASIGTAFLACSDNPDVNDDYKQRILAGTGEQTTYTDLYDNLAHALGGWKWPEGIAARLLRNPLVEEWSGREDELMRNLDKVASTYEPRRHDPDVRPVYAGKGVGEVTRIQPANEIISSLMADADAALAL